MCLTSKRIKNAGNIVPAKEIKHADRGESVALPHIFDESPNGIAVLLSTVGMMEMRKTANGTHSEKFLAKKSSIKHPFDNVCMTK